MLHAFLYLLLQWLYWDCFLVLSQDSKRSNLLFFGKCGPKTGQTASRPDGHQHVFPYYLCPWNDHWYFFNSIQVKFYIEVNMYHIQLHNEDWNPISDHTQPQNLSLHPMVKKPSSALRESIPRLFNGGRTIMTTRCAPACSQTLPVKPQGGLGQTYWSVSVVTLPPKSGVSEVVFRALQPNGVRMEFNLAHVHLAGCTSPDGIGHQFCIMNVATCMK